MGAIFLGLTATALVMLVFTFTAHGVVSACVTVFFIGASGSLCLPALQTRLIDVAGEAQSLAAAGQHSALNVANAIGAFLGGLVITAGFGYTAPALVGAGLAVAGIGVLVVADRLERRTARAAVPVDRELADAESLTV